MEQQQQKEIHEVIKFNEYQINMYGYRDNAAFNPNEICQILGIEVDQKRIVQIRKIYKFGTDLQSAPKVRGKEIILVTERGMHEIIMGSNSKIATQLKDFISNILSNLRKENNQLKNDIQILQQQNLSLVDNIPIIQQKQFKEKQIQYMEQQQQKEIHEVIKFNEYQINMYGYKDNAAFNPNEICQILDIQSDNGRMTQLKKQYKFQPALNAGPKVRGKEIVLINERGMYEIIMTSRSQKSQELRDFISNILSNLRKKGEITNKDIQKLIQPDEEEKILRQQQKENPDIQFSNVEEQKQNNSNHDSENFEDSASQIQQNKENKQQQNKQENKQELDNVSIISQSNDVINTLYKKVKDVVQYLKQKYQKIDMQKAIQQEVQQQLKPILQIQEELQKQKKEQQKKEKQKEKQKDQKDIQEQIKQNKQQQKQIVHVTFNNIEDQYYKHNQQYSQDDIKTIENIFKELTVHSEQFIKRVNIKKNHQDLKLQYYNSVMMQQDGKVLFVSKTGTSSNTKRPTKDYQKGKIQYDYLKDKSLKNIIIINSNNDTEGSIHVYIEQNNLGSRIYNKGQTEYYAQSPLQFFELVEKYFLLMRDVKIQSNYVDDSKKENVLIKMEETKQKEQETKQIQTQEQTKQMDIINNQLQQLRKDYDDDLLTKEEYKKLSIELRKKLL